MDGFYEAPAGFFDKSVTDANISETYKLLKQKLIKQKTKLKAKLKPSYLYSESGLEDVGDLLFVITKLFLCDLVYGQ